LWIKPCKSVNWIKWARKRKWINPKNGIKFCGLNLGKLQGKHRSREKKSATTKTLFSFTGKYILKYPMADQDESELHFLYFSDKAW